MNYDKIMKKSSGGKNKKQTTDNKNILSIVFGVLSIVALFARCFLLDNPETSRFICGVIAILLALGFIPSLNSKGRIASNASLASACALGLTLLFTIESSDAIYGITALIVCVLLARIVNYALGREFGRKDPLYFTLASGVVTVIYFALLGTDFTLAQDLFNNIFGIASFMLVTFLATLPGLATKSK